MSSSSKSGHIFSSTNSSRTFPLLKAVDIITNVAKAAAAANSSVPQNANQTSNSSTITRSTNPSVSSESHAVDRPRERTRIALPDLTNFRCKVCRRQFPSPQSLGGHYNSHRRVRTDWKKKIEFEKKKLISLYSGRIHKTPPVVPRFKEPSIDSWVHLLEVEEPYFPEEMLLREISQPLPLQLGEGSSTSKDVHADDEDMSIFDLTADEQMPPEHDCDEDILSWLDTVIIEPEQKKAVEMKDAATQC